jgi:hypothetical protein
MSNAAESSSIDRTVPEQKTNRTEVNVVAGIIFLVVLLTTLPYLLAYSVSNTFVGQIYNIVDFSVYLSWTRQAADGHFGTLNLFTTVKQHGYLFNCLFLVLGNVVRVTGLPIPIVFQIFRVGGAILLLWVAYLLCRTTYPTSVQARLTSFALIALSSGFGFVYWPKWIDHNVPQTSVDIWQPEAFTFLSIYATVLFVVATIFILTAFYNLVRGEQTGQYKYAVYAGLCGLVLGNIHSYDILHIAAGWGLYLIVITAAERKFDISRWLRALIAGALALPSSAYQYWVFLHEPVFNARAKTPTLSPNLYFYMMGYGLVFFLAAIAIALIITRRRDFVAFFRSGKVATWVVCWAIAGLTIIYLPVEFQRKMAMGEHIPLCILAGGAAAYLVSHSNRALRPVLLCILVAATFPTNALFLSREYRHIENGRSEISQANLYLTQPQVDVLGWIKKNTKPGEAILAFQPISQFIPGYCDRAVWVGHWSETPDYASKSAQLLTNFLASTSDEDRQNFILGTQTDYLVYWTSTAGEQPRLTRHGPEYLDDLGASPPKYLTPVYTTKTSSADAQASYTIFKINR